MFLVIPIQNRSTKYFGYISAGDFHTINMEELVSTKSIIILGFRFYSSTLQLFCFDSIIICFPLIMCNLIMFYHNPKINWGKSR